jgi:hypothetical protein
MTHNHLEAPTTSPQTITVTSRDVIASIETRAPPCSSNGDRNALKLGVSLSIRRRYLFCDITVSHNMVTETSLANHRDVMMRL